MSFPIDKDVFDAMQQNEALQRAFLNDPTVNHAVRSGEPFASIVARLSDEKTALQKMLVKIQAIAPKKTRMPDGKVLVWRCPDHLVP